MNFEQVAKDVLLKLAKKPIETRLCPDQYVGLISKFSSCKTDFPKRVSVESRPSDVKCVIMILESPHIFEFAGDLGPAKGTTGRLIRNEILRVKEMAKYEEYGLVLMNAVQNQCSLGFKTACYRDSVFVSAWKNGAEKCFVSRLNSVFRDGDVIVNCCTKGSMGKNELRRLVHKSIPKDKKKVLRRAHPSSWYSEKNRGFEWKLA